MSQNNCQCPVAGHCPFHNMLKTEYLWKLCQTDERYRALWDNIANGSGNTVTQPKSQPSSPGWFQKAANLGSSLVNHALGGFKQVTETEKQQRLDTCRECPDCNLKDGEPETCRLCGCYLQIKAGWQSEQCPANKWKPLDVLPEPEPKVGCCGS